MQSCRDKIHALPKFMLKWLRRNAVNLHRKTHLRLSNRLNFHSCCVLAMPYIACLHLEHLLFKFSYGRNNSYKTFGHYNLWLFVYLVIARLLLSIQELVYTCCAGLPDKPPLRLKELFTAQLPRPVTWSSMLIFWLHLLPL